MHCDYGAAGMPERDKGLQHDRTTNPRGRVRSIPPNYDAIALATDSIPF